jgi:poly(3-hydroxybutyrate) depolymerase
MHITTFLALILCAGLSAGDRLAEPRVLQGGKARSKALVVALHGGSFRGRPPLERAQQLLEDLDSDAGRAGLRLLVPVAEEFPAPGPYRVPWLRPEGEAQVWALVRAETDGRRADPRRVFLAGHGAGATAALTLAARQPALVAGVAAWSGTPEPLWDEERRVVGLAEPVVEGLLSVPVFLRTARDDPYLDRDALRLLVDGLRAQAREHHLPGPTWLEGDGGHGWGPEGPAEGLKWLAKVAK